MGPAKMPRVVDSAAGIQGARLVVDFTDPAATSVAGVRGEWFLLDASGASDEATAALAGGDSADAFCTRNRGSLVVHVTVHEGQATRLDVWRGILSQAELFYSIRPSGAVIASDHLRNVMARLPIADRFPTDRAVAEHHLIRRLAGPTTMSAAITHLGHAEHLSVDLGSGAVTSRVFDRFSAEVERRKPADYLDMIDAELAVSLPADDNSESTAVFFSGGVDSALLMSYLRGRADAVTFVPNSPEFAPETSDAREAAAMLGVKITEVPMAETDFLEMLEDATEAAATPCFDDSEPYFNRLVHSQPHSTFIAGQGADSAFGMSLKLARVASWFRNPRISPVLTAASKRTPGHVGYRMRQLAPKAEGFGRSHMDPFGFAGSYITSGDNPLLRKVVGKGLIEDVQRDHLKYITDRIELVADPESPLFSHIELAHWSVLLINPMMSSQASARANGKVVAGPYNSPNLLAALATIPAEDRYIRGLSAKWILKDLLARRLPEYPINRRKKSTALPWRRFYERGPLTGFWDNYAIPGIFLDLEDELTSTPSATTWSAISYAVWEKQVARNKELVPHSPAIARDYAIGSGSGL